MRLDPPDTEMILETALRRLRELISPRLTLADLQYYSFPQEWPMSVLGFEGACRLDGQVTVVMDADRNVALVYFQSRFVCATVPDERLLGALRGFRLSHAGLSGDGGVGGMLYS